MYFKEWWKKKTTYSNGEFQFFSKCSLVQRQNFHSNKNMHLAMKIEHEVVTPLISKDVEIHLSLCSHCLTTTPNCHAELMKQYVKKDFNYRDKTLLISQ
jgi:hypothetical protein